MKVIYTALFVKDPAELLRRFPPIHAKFFAHHSTIAFRPKDLAGIDVGKEMDIKILGRITDEKGDVLLVENPKSTNKHPHITISCAEGVVPAYSQELLEKAFLNGSVKYFDNREIVSIIEGYFDGIKDCLKL